jgi:hypothetical protein
MTHDIIVLITICLGAIEAAICGRIFGKVVDDFESGGKCESDWLLRHCTTFVQALLALWIGGHFFGFAGGALGFVLGLCPGYWLIGLLNEACERCASESSSKSRSRSSSTSDNSSKGIITLFSVMAAVIMVLVTEAKFGPVPALVVATIGTVLAPVLAVGALLLTYMTMGVLFGGVVPHLFRLLGRALDRQADRISSLLRNLRRKIG